MNRYREYEVNDDQPIEDGDNSLLGVNQYDSGESLKPGICQAAVNMDFSSQDASTRGGLVCLPELGATPFDSPWVLRSAAAGNTWMGVAYGNGRFVAVSNDGGTSQVMTSFDGITWSIQTSAATKLWTAICFGNGLFVAVAQPGASNLVMTSTDGVTWTSRTTPADAGWVSVAYGNGIYVAVADATTTDHVMTSPDGITWTLRTAAADIAWKSVTYGNGTFVAVANSGSGDRIMSSTDGITWTLRTPPAVKGWNAVTYGAGLFVAVASGVSTTNEVMTSPDGITWSGHASAAGLSWASIAYGSNSFVAVSTSGVGNRAMISPDGLTWKSGSSAANDSWTSVVFGSGLFVAVSANGTVMTLSAVKVYATGSYSDPSAIGSPWIVLAGTGRAGFFAFGQTSRYVNYPSGYVISEQSTIVQANNLLFIFSGPSQTPIQWDGAWGGAFITCPASTLGTGYEDIPPSNQATYYQNRLWVPKGKDTLSASQLLDFKNFNVLANSFNLNVGASDYIVSSYPFANNALVVFKNHSSYLLQNVDGTLTDVTSTEITRQLGIIGINACVAVGPDLIYFSSERNITSVRLNIQNATQSVTVPLSRNINPIIDRINWTYANKISMGYNNNLLYVALPLDNATVCSTIIVYNFITGQWFGEWSFAPELNMAIQDFIDSNYLGRIQMHAITEDGRIFVLGQGQNDISGTIVAEISTSLTTRAYSADNNSKITRRMYADLSTNRPDFSVEAFSEGASESSDVITNQTFSRADSWLFNDAAYAMNNSNDDYNRAFRKDYSSGPDSIQSGTGFQPEMTQDYRLPLITRRKGRLAWFKITNTTGKITINGIGVESRAGDRSSLTQVG